MNVVHCLLKEYITSITRGFLIYHPMIPFLSSYHDLD